MGWLFISVEIGEDDKTVVILADINLAILPARLIRRRVAPWSGQIEIGISKLE